jgi:CBS domain containing-hemolysin-like protein
MSSWLILVGLVLSATASLLFSTLTYALRDLSRVRLAEHLERRKRGTYLNPTVEHADDLILVTAVGRMFANIFIVVFALWLFDTTGYRPAARYALAALLSAALHLFCSVALPNAIAKHAGAAIVAACVGFLHGMRTALRPLTKLMHLVDDAVRKATGAGIGPEPADMVQQEILSAVEEGEKEGLVGEEEREMIESVIQLRATTAGQVMTARPEIIALPLNATLSTVKQTLEESGHSRIPVYEGTLDHVVGMLYARDLLKFLGQASPKFDMRSALRPAFFVPETKPLRDLLHDFRVKKVHIAIVLDEYGGTSGLVTIEDVLEELVGDISDEHEPLEPAMFKPLSENAAEADARMYIDELNRRMGLNLPEDAGYDTLGGYITTTLGRIPEPGTVFEHDGVRFTVLEAEPQKVNRVRIEVIPQPAEEPVGSAPEGM